MEQRDLEDYRKQYLDKHGFEKQQVHYRRKKILQLFEKYSPKKILEVGCGVDSLAAHYSGYSEFTVVEPVGEFVSVAQAQCQDNVQFIEKMLEDASEDLAPKKFDFIVISSLIHELPEPEAIIKIARGLAGPKTIVHVNTPNAHSIHRMLGVHMGLLPSLKESSELAKTYQRNHEFELNDLIEMGERLGFETFESGSYFLKPLSHSQMERLLSEQKITDKFLDAIFNISSLLPNNGSEIFVNWRKK